MTMLKFFARILGFSKKESIRILMYHMVLPKDKSYKENLIVTTEDLEKQFEYIQKNYQTLFFKELKSKKSLQNKIILTFDDGYYNNLEYLLPLLEKYQLKATIFIPTELIKKDEQNDKRKMMTFDEIRSLNPELIEIALHSHTHRNYSQISLQEAEEDLRENMAVLEEKQITFTKVLAYPYGKFPKKNPQKEEFFRMLERSGITAAVRIGNNVEYYPWKNKFEIKRIDIKGRDSFNAFKWKLRLGKIKL